MSFSSPIRVLLLEDNPGDAHMVRTVLAQDAKGEFSIAAAERLADALARLRADPFDVMLCDLGLPDSEGLATAQTLIAQFPALPLVVLTGSHDHSIGREVIRHGAQDYLVKGESSGALISRTLRYAIERKRLEHELRDAKLALEERVNERTLELADANRSLRESEARFRTLTHMSSDFYWESDADHRLTSRESANTRPSAIDVFRLGGQIGQCRWETPSRSPDEAGWRAHRAVLDEHRSFRDFEFSRLDNDGEEHIFSISGDPMIDDAGKFRGYRGVGTEITSRKLSERELQAAAETLSGLLDQDISGIFVIQDGRFAFVNSRANEIAGLGPSAQLLGSDPLQWVAEEDRVLVAERMCSLLAGEVKSSALEFDASRGDGIVVRIAADAARATHNGRPALIGVMQDISEKARADEKIKAYIEQLRVMLIGTVNVATTLSSLRDPYTGGHERRVAELAVAIGRQLGFDEDRLQGLQIAGSMHDIGKITIPAEILSKPGKLSALEFQLIQLHPQAGYDVLKNVDFPWPVAEVALQHHERIDGSGYPHGLKDDAILLESRIMAVADVVEAMSSHRPYRAGLGIDKALAEIERGRGAAFDPAVVDACLHLFRHGAFAFATAREKESAT